MLTFALDIRPEFAEVLTETVSTTPIALYVILPLGKLFKLLLIH